MAVRINLTAIRDCPPAEIRAVMSEVIRVSCAAADCEPAGDQLDIREHGGWAWFTTSVWGVNSADFDRGLCKLARPALQFSTSDGDRWYLTVHGGPQGQVHFLHEFGYHRTVFDPANDGDYQAGLDNLVEPEPVDPELAFLEEEREPEIPRVPFDAIADDLRNMGGDVPGEFLASVAHLPYSAAANRYREWHAERVSLALAQAGIPHDSPAVRAVLLWEGLTENEIANDLGNLPRLLAVLGLGEGWETGLTPVEAPTEPESPMVAEEPEPPSAPVDPFAPALAFVEPLGLTPVANGPFSLPLKELAVIRFFVEALSIHNTANVVLKVAVPAGTSIPAPNEESGNAVEVTGDGFRAFMDNHLWFQRSDLKNLLGKKLHRLLYHLPDDSGIEVAFSHPELSALNQRYRGPVLNGEWRIAETYPALTRAALAEGMKLARYARKDHARHKLRDEAEASAVSARAARDPNLWESKVVQSGRFVSCQSDIVGHLPKVIFRHRFAAFWDVAAHDREADRQYREYLDRQRQMRKAGAKAARRRAAPHDEAVLYRGRLGPYWASDFARLTELEQETRTNSDASLATLGFRHVGDFVAKHQRDILLRVHIAPDGSAYALLAAKRTLYLGYQFFTRFADGSTLTTRSNGAESSRPLLKVYTKDLPRLSATELHEKHRWGIGRFQAHKSTVPITLDSTLAGAAQMFDRSMAQAKGVGQHFRIVSPPPGEPPLAIRAAWVGCVLPLFAATDDEKVGTTMRGALSQEEVETTAGYAVVAQDAIAILDRRAPDATAWWRKNAPQSLTAGKLMLFAAEACELAEE